MASQLAFVHLLIIIIAIIIVETDCSYSNNLYFKYNGNGYCVNEALEALQVHNELRSNHGVPPLTLDEQLCLKAQQWAQHLADRDTELEHSPHAGISYGENAYWGSYHKTRDTIESFYKEIENYNFDYPELSRGITGHFTQVVWKKTKFMGYGVAKTRSGYFYAIVTYFPPQGSSPREKRLNVPRPINNNWQNLFTEDGSQQIQNLPPTIQIFEFNPGSYSNIYSSGGGGGGSWDNWGTDTIYQSNFDLNYFQPFTDILNSGNYPLRYPHNDYNNNNYWRSKPYHTTIMEGAWVL